MCSGCLGSQAVPTAFALTAVPTALPADCFALPQLLKEAVESQRMCELMKQQETHLKQQVSCLPYVLCLFCCEGFPPSLNNPKLLHLDKRGRIPPGFGFRFRDCFPALGAAMASGRRCLWNALL